MNQFSKVFYYLPEKDILRIQKFGTGVLKQLADEYIEHPPKIDDEEDLFYACETNQLIRMKKADLSKFTEEQIGEGICEAGDNHHLEMVEYLVSILEEGIIKFESEYGFEFALEVGLGGVCNDDTPIGRKINDLLFDKGAITCHRCCFDREYHLDQEYFEKKILFGMRI